PPPPSTAFPYTTLFRSVRVRRDRDGARAAVQLSARVLDRVPRWALAEPVPALHRRAVLRHVPDPHARVGDDPRRPGAGRPHPPRSEEHTSELQSRGHLV